MLCFVGWIILKNWLFTYCKRSRKNNLVADDIFVLYTGVFADRRCFFRPPQCFLVAIIWSTEPDHLKYFYSCSFSKLSSVDETLSSLHDDRSQKIGDGGKISFLLCFGCGFLEITCSGWIWVSYSNKSLKRRWWGDLNFFISQTHSNGNGIGENPKKQLNIWIFCVAIEYR